MSEMFTPPATPAEAPPADLGPAPVEADGGKDDACTGRVRRWNGVDVILHDGPCPVDHSDLAPKYSEAETYPASPITPLSSTSIFETIAPLSSASIFGTAEHVDQAGQSGATPVPVSEQVAP